MELNLRGQTKGFVVRKSLLCSVPNSTLEALFSGRHHIDKVEGKYFLDRDPQIFRYVINYLGNGRYPIIKDEETQKLFDEEIDFWQLNSFKNEVNQKIAEL